MHRIILIGLLAAAAGCKDKNADQPKAPGSTAQLKGKVTYQGKPVPAGLVRVMAEDSREEAVTRIQKDGSYAVAGPIGKVRVVVDTTIVRDELDEPERSKWYRPIPSRYMGYSNTPIRLDITGDQTLDVDLTDPS